MPVFDPAKEQRILEAIRAYKNGSAPSLNEAARRHDIAPSTVKHRYNGRNTCGARQKQPTNQALTNGEEEVLVKWIIQLWSQNFPARLDLPLDVGLFSHYLRAYGDTVNSFCERGGTGIGKWDFIDLISNARQKAFTDKTIIGGWKGSGLFLFDSLKVLESLSNFTKANYIQSLKVIIDNVEDNVPDAPTAQTPANPAVLRQFVDAICPHLDSPLKRKLDKVTKAASNLFM
ncbi:hypothetical protein Dda_5063 [Drechslerella dactyloides]|uniref:HTH psq-type domain-containing protein n=1 Tax=Drechslerella dactyloides TaxID=74499 RepID=A0AAD6NJZ2_DREDA|nr:hypothetical protein Dda_5063 [Drechslerella dactyloides]